MVYRPFNTEFTQPILIVAQMILVHSNVNSCMEEFDINIVSIIRSIIKYVKNLCSYVFNLLNFNIKKN